MYVCTTFKGGKKQFNKYWGKCLAWNYTLVCDLFSCYSNDYKKMKQLSYLFKRKLIIKFYV